MDRALFTMPSTVAEAVKPSFLENRIAEGRTREHFAIIDLYLSAQAVELLVPPSLKEYRT